MKTFSPRKLIVQVRRWIVLAFIVCYVAAVGFFFFCHVLGDTSRFAAGYFWTWDMFPNYPLFSARRMALGQTQSGKYVQVFPTAQTRFRRGGHKDFTRFDLPRNDAALREAAAQTLKAHPPSESEDPVTYVFLVETYWPVRFNLPDELYLSAYGKENPHRKAFRVLDEGTVNPRGTVNWSSAR